MAVVVIAVSGTVQGQEIEGTKVAIGLTDLFNEAQALVGYRYFDQEPSTLGYGWVGFDAASGVYFVPEDATGMVGQVFMHCPWRGGKGTAFADYLLNLPKTTRIRLRFEIGIRPTAKKTDGVTYRVRAGNKMLFEQHCRWKEFRPFEVDLSEFAGTQIALRLEVDPGPARDTTDDWSLWRKVEILAGSEVEIAAAKARAEAEAAKRRAADLERGQRLAEVSLAPLTSHRNDSICPGVLHPTKVTTREDDGAYVFSCVGDERIEYRFAPKEGLLSGVSVSVNDQALKPAPFYGGPRIHLDGRDFAAPTRSLQAELVAAKRDGVKVTCRYRYTNSETESSTRLTVVLWPEGKSLGLEVRGEPDGASGFLAKPYLGHPVPAAFAAGGPAVWRREGVYVSTVADVTRSEASVVGRDGVTYTPLTNGKRNAMHDYLYLTVTSRYEETLPNITHSPSPFLGELAHRLVLDVWGGAFADNERWLKEIAAYGIDGFLIIKHVWQRDGYDRSYPNTIPANAAQGGDENLKRLSLAAQRLGHRFCVHENYYDYYPNAEAFKAADCALDPAGKPQRGWDRGPVVASILKPSKLMEYVRVFSPEIKRRYECNAAYHDIMPTTRVDFDANVADAGKLRVTDEYTRQLCDYDRELFGGPVVFEAASPRMAGVYDGGCNHGVDTYRTPVAVAYEVLKVHPKMSEHGFGYYERWLPWGYGPGWGTYVMTDRELDKYRAYEIAFGRTGFIGQQLMKHPHGVVREYYLMQALGRAYTGRLVEHIRYQVDDKWVDAGTAARYGELARLNVEYEDGQQVYVNLADSTLEVQGQKLPQFGMLTVGPRAQAWTALRDGQICDYAAYGDLIYVDARSHVWQPPTAPPPIEPSVAAVKDVGGRQFELTVNWKVARKPQRDYTIFWHFKRDGKIAFQRDHKPARPATTWQVGETVTDGPLSVTVEDDANVTVYDIVVGLYDKQGRAPLVRGANELRIGRLLVKRDGGRATAVSYEPTPPDRTPGTDPQEYLKGANVARKVIDFGEVATNGAVVLRKAGARREIVPVPVGESMTIGLRGKTGSLRCLNGEGQDLPPPAVTRRNGKMWFRTQPEAAKYILAP